MLIARCLLAALFLASTVSAALTEFTPAAPTTAGPVSVTITSEPSTPCPPQVHALTRNGKTVRLELERWTGACIAVVRPWKATFDLGSFAAGDYLLEVLLDNQPYLTAPFVVRQANPPFTVRPFANVSRPSGPQVDPGAEAIIESVSPNALCRTEACPGVKVLFGDVAVQPSSRLGYLTVRVPAHPPGVVDVKIVDEARGVTMTSPGAVYFYDRNAAPDLTVWSRVLFPVLQSGAGAFGAQWTTDAVIDNRNDYEVENFNRVDSLMCVDYGCERLGVRHYLKFEGRNHPNGAVLFVPREAVDRFNFASRVRDKARESDDFGTEIPVVRESAMRRTQFRLLDIPVTGSYRSKLRVYVYTTDDNLQVPVQVSYPDRESFSFRQLRLQRIDRNLAYAELDLQTIPNLASDRVIVDIAPPELELPTWAFVTVTNNATQRVTIVTPN
jgi:hypothetical protein